MTIITRRKFLGLSAAVTALVVTGCGSSNEEISPSTEGGNTGDDINETTVVGKMPDEAERHTRTWMAFGASDQIHEPKNINGLRDDLAKIALSIAAYEPVSILVRANELNIAKMKMNHPNISFVTGSMDDFWTRDTGAVFVKNAQNKLIGVDFNFNGWGNKQAHNRSLSLFIYG